MDPDAIFDILVEHCGAHENDRPSFRHHWPCLEFRFMGSLGYGGKIYSQGQKVWVDCYNEDRSPAAAAAINTANRLLNPTA